MYLCVYVCTYVCMHVCKYVCVYVCIIMYVCMYVLYFLITYLQHAPLHPVILHACRKLYIIYIVFIFLRICLLFTH